MTAQEAIKDIVENGIELGAGDYVDVEALKVAISALKKQIPKKPKKLTYKLLIDSGWEYECPNCGCKMDEVEE